LLASFLGSQLLIGHGNLSADLHRFAIRESEHSVCGMAEETPEHVRDGYVIEDRQRESEWSDIRGD